MTRRPILALHFLVLLPGTATATLQTIISENFEDDANNAKPPTNVGLPGTWQPGTGLKVTTNSSVSPGTKSALEVNADRIPEYDLNGYLKADTKVTTFGQTVHAEMYLANGDGYMAFGITTDATATTPLAQTKKALVYLQSQQSTNSYNNDLLARDSTDSLIDLGVALHGPNNPPNGMFDKLSFDYTVGSATMSLSLNNAAPLSVPLRNPGGAVDGFFFTDADPTPITVTYYSIDNLLMTTNTLGSPGWYADSGDWNILGNWVGSIPNSFGAVAAFEKPGNTTQTVFTNTPVTVGKLRLNSLNNYVITGTGSLTIQTASGSGTIEVLQGNEKINLPLIFASNASINVSPGAALTIADVATIKANKTVTKSGNVTIAGPLILETGASLVATSEPLYVSGGISLASTAKLDLTKSSLVMNYSGQSSPANSVRDQLASAYANGAWGGNGLTTSASIIGQTGLGFVDDPQSESVSVAYAYYGDANLDGSVNSLDFTRLASHFNGAGAWAQGDFNYDGIVNAMDFNALASNFGRPSLSAAATDSLVPEPAILGTLAIAICLRRRRVGRD